MIKVNECSNWTSIDGIDESRAKELLSSGHTLRCLFWDIEFTFNNPDKQIPICLFDRVRSSNWFIKKEWEPIDFDTANGLLFNNFTIKCIYKNEAYLFSPSDSIPSAFLDSEVTWWKPKELEL